MPSLTALSDAKTTKLDHAKPEDTKREPGASWKADEMHLLPKNRLSIVRALISTLYWDVLMISGVYGPNGLRFLSCH